MTRVTQRLPSSNDAFSFASEAAQVVSMRLMLIALGSRAGVAEAQSMVNEKVGAFIHVQWKLATGSYGLTPQSMVSGVYNHYARIVRGNRKRLSMTRKGGLTRSQ